MRAALSLCTFLFFLGTLAAQDLILTPIGETLCKPGVINKSPGKGLLMEYGINPNVRLQTNNASISSGSSKIAINKRFIIKLKAPIINREKFKLLLGWNYYGEAYNFDYIGAGNATILNDVNNKDLKSSRISLYMIKPINHKYYFAVKGVASFNGDYKGALNFDKRYTRYDVAMVFGVKKHTNIEWGVGLLARKNFTNSFPVIPFAIYNHTFNSKWGIETTIPTNLMVRYNISDKQLLLFGPQYDSRTYSIDIEDSSTFNEAASYTMQRSEMRLAVRYQRNIKSWLWTELSTGYVRNFTTRFELTEDGFDAKEIGFTPSDGMFFKLGLFLSPPKSMYK